MSWADERRENQRAAADIRRDDEDAAVDRQIRLRAAAVDEQIKLGAAQEATRKDRKADAKKARDDAAAWAGEHMVEVLVYGLAVVCAAMAVPAMAGYGLDLYGPPGLLLPAMSELGPWALAIAVAVSRQRHPDRNVRWLIAGIWLFAGVGGGMNLAHGWDAHGPLGGAAMAAVSVAGIIVHQLAVANPPRSRAQRLAARTAREADRRVGRAERIAARTAVVDLAGDGSARLVHRPGLYVPTRRHLEATTVPGLPTDSAGPDGDWDAALAALDVDGGPVEPALRGGSTTEGSTESTGSTTEADQEFWSGGSGRVAVLDPDESTGESGDDESGRPGPTRPIDPQARRRLPYDEALDAARRLARREGRPVNAEELRRALQVGVITARRIRDEVNAELFGGDDGDAGAQR
jgi:hypothetical protein